MVIDITADSSSATNISPVTISITLSSTASTMSPSQSSKRTRRSSKQASENRLKSKQTKVEDGIAGTSPKKNGPAPKIQHEFLETVATHAEVCQVGDGELRGKDLRRLIGASIVGTAHANLYKTELVWRKVRTKFPESLQAATKIAVEDARAQWTTHDNLNQWFDDVKKDLLVTGLLVEDEVVFGKEGEVVSEVRFKMHSKRRIINMDETHHDLSDTGDKGGSRAVLYHNPLYQRVAVRGVKSARHVTGVYATDAAGEALPPFIYI